MPRSQDRFANIAMVSATESGVTTLTYKELLTGVSLGASIGILIDQIDYFIPNTAFNSLVDDGDGLQIAWCVSDTPTALVADDRSIIHMMEMTKELLTSGVAIDLSPKVFQFFPPIIRASPRLYLAVLGVATAAALTVQSRLYFRYIDLTTQEYLELAETGLVLG